MVQQGDIQTREDLKSSYDEADYIIPQQVNQIHEKQSCIIGEVLSNGTDVFVFLCWHTLKLNWSSLQLYMAKFAEDTKWISINKSVTENSEILPSITDVHVLTGCDYVPMMFGVGKLTALKIAKR